MGEYMEATASCKVLHQLFLKSYIKSWIMKQVLDYNTDLWEWVKPHLSESEHLNIQSQK